MGVFISIISLTVLLRVYMHNCYQCICTVDYTKWLAEN